MCVVSITTNNEPNAIRHGEKVIPHLQISRSEKKSSLLKLFDLGEEDKQEELSDVSFVTHKGCRQSVVLEGGTMTVMYIYILVIIQYHTTGALIRGSS